MIPNQIADEYRERLIILCTQTISNIVNILKRALQPVIDVMNSLPWEEIKEEMEKK